MTCVLNKRVCGGNTFEHSGDVHVDRFKGSSHGRSYIMPVQTCGNQCGVVRRSFIQKVEIQSIKSLYQIKVFTLNPTFLTWENQQQSSLKV